MSDLLAPDDLTEPKQPASKPHRRLRRVLSVTAGLVAACAVIGTNVPTVGAAVVSWYHHYQVTRPAYEAKYGLWTELNIPSKFRVNGIHSTLLYNGDVLIMAGSGNNDAFFNAGTFKTLLLNPQTMQVKMIPTPWDLFCAGHSNCPTATFSSPGAPPGTRTSIRYTPAAA
jgi:hypothetical protein